MSWLDRVKHWFSFVNKLVAFLVVGFLDYLCVRVWLQLIWHKTIDLC